MDVKEIEKSYKTNSRVVNKHQKIINGLEKYMRSMFENRIVSCENLDEIDGVWEEIKKESPKSHTLIDWIYSDKKQEIKKHTQKIITATKKDGNGASPAFGYSLKEPIFIKKYDGMLEKSDLPGWFYDSVWKSISYFDEDSLERYFYHCENMVKNGWTERSAKSYRDTYKRIVYPSQEKIEEHFHKHKNSWQY